MRARLRPSCDRDASDANDNLLVYVAGSCTGADWFDVQNEAKLEGRAG